jgi:hypothetical protein
MTDVRWEQKHTHRVLMGKPEGKGPPSRPRLGGRTILERYKSWCFRGDRIHCNFLGQTAASEFENFPTFWELNPSPSSGSDLHTTRPPTQRTVTRFCIDTICLSWWWARCARNMWRVKNKNKYIVKNCVSRWSFTKNHNMMHGQQNVKAMKIGTELFPETSENLRILTRLSVRENFIENWMVSYKNRMGGSGRDWSGAWQAQVASCCELEQTTSAKALTRPLYFTWPTGWYSGTDVPHNIAHSIPHYRAKIYASGYIQVWAA